MDIKFDNNIPIYIQLLDKVKTAIISGEYGCGEKLPSVREFALKFKVNPNTMQKALNELETEGLIYTERTNGKFVTQKRDVIIKLKERYAKNIAKEYFSSMKKIGFDKNEAIAIIKEKGSDL